MFLKVCSWFRSKTYFSIFLTIAYTVTFNSSGQEHIKVTTTTTIQACIENLKDQLSTKDSLFTFIDFTKPSYEKRLFVYNLKDSSVIFSSLVAHGRNSGNIKAYQFSNRKESYQSSLGLFKTGETYYGKHGYSLRLDGLEKNINHNARTRSIVIHGAPYVSRNFIERYGRLGRSLGCPAVPEEDVKKLIALIKEGSPLFIYAPQYYKTSKENIQAK